jgi:general secretion pathway protein B
MSYILEALKKSDLQRQRGATPTLQAAQIAVAVPKRPMFIYYGLLAAVLLGAGIMIGWLQPWQPEQPPFATEPVAAKSPISIPQQATPAPLTTPPEMPGAMIPNNPALASAGTTVAAAPIPDKTMPDKFISEKPTSLAGVAQEQKAIPFDELPIPIQREIPDMTVQLHSYSSNPGERLVYINSIRLREGEPLMLGLRLEQITPDGMIFSYKGYRFQRGIR